MCLCVSVCVCDALRMLYKLKPSFLSLFDLHCFGFIDFYWTNKKNALNFSISKFPLISYGCPFLVTNDKLRFFFFQPLNFVESSPLLCVCVQVANLRKVAMS